MGTVRRQPFGVVIPLRIGLDFKVCCQSVWQGPVVGKYHKKAKTGKNVCSAKLVKAELPEGTVVWAHCTAAETFQIANAMWQMEIKLLEEGKTHL